MLVKRIRRYKDIMCEKNENEAIKNFCTAILVGEIFDYGWLQHFRLRAGYQSGNIEESLIYSMWGDCNYVWEEVDYNKTPI